MAPMASPSYGMHVRIVAQPGRGDDLAGILRQAAAALEANRDCRLYIVSRSLDDADSVWVTEAWTDRGSHAASLQDERARSVIAQARPIIAAFADRAEFQPEFGKGL